MATDGKINTEITVNGTKYQADLEKIVQDTIGAMKKVEKVGNPVNDAMKAMGELFAVDKIRGAVEQQAKLADTIQSTSANLGVSSDFLQQYQKAMQPFNIETADATATLEKLQKAIVAAGDDAKGPAAKAFGDLGVQFRNANGELRGTAELMPEIFTHFGSLATQADKARVAEDLFSKSGKGMIEALSGGWGSIEKGMRDATIYTKEEIQALADLNQMLDKTKASMGMLVGKGFNAGQRVFEYLFNSAAGNGFGGVETNDYLTKKEHQRNMAEARKNELIAARIKAGQEEEDRKVTRAALLATGKYTTERTSLVEKQLELEKEQHKLELRKRDILENQVLTDGEVKYQSAELKKDWDKHNEKMKDMLYAKEANQQAFNEKVQQFYTDTVEANRKITQAKEREAFDLEQQTRRQREDYASSQRELSLRIQDKLNLGGKDFKEKYGKLTADQLEAERASLEAQYGADEQHKILQDKRITELSDLIDDKRRFERTKEDYETKQLKAKQKLDDEALAETARNNKLLVDAGKLAKEQLDKGLANASISLGNTGTLGVNIGNSNVQTTPQGLTALQIQSQQDAMMESYYKKMTFNLDRLREELAD